MTNGKLKHSGSQQIIIYTCNHLFSIWLKEINSVKTFYYQYFCCFNLKQLDPVVTLKWISRIKWISRYRTCLTNLIQFIFLSRSGWKYTMKWKENRCSRYLEKKHRNFAPFLVGLSFVFSIFILNFLLIFNKQMWLKNKDKTFFCRSSFYLYSYNTPDDKSAWTLSTLYPLKTDIKPVFH